MTIDTDLAQQIEKEAINKLYRYLDALHAFERPLAAIMRRKYSSEELLEAEDKRCIVAVRGLRYHELVLFFKVTNLSIQQVEPYEGYDTFFETSIRTVNTLLARVLSGDDDAFGDVITGNEVKVRGPHSFHDMSIFKDVFAELARNIKQIRAVTK